MANQPAIINDASVDDIPDLVSLLNELFRIEQDFTPNTKKQTKGLALIIQNQNTAIIKVARNTNHKVIGMVSVQLLYSTAQGSYSAWIEDMIVNKAYRNHGIGKAILTAALAWAKEKGATRAQLLADVDNEQALGYYQHLGWQTSKMRMLRIKI